MSPAVRMLGALKLSAVLRRQKGGSFHLARVLVAVISSVFRLGCEVITDVDADQVVENTVNRIPISVK